MKQSKQKLYVWELHDLGIDFYHYDRIKNSQGFGYIYILCNKLTDEQKEILGKYKNVLITHGHWKDIPTVSNDAIILMDKKISPSSPVQRTSMEIN